MHTRNSSTGVINIYVSDTIKSLIDEIPTSKKPELTTGIPTSTIGRIAAYYNLNDVLSYDELVKKMETLSTNKEIFVSYKKKDEIQIDSSKIGLYLEHLMDALKGLILDPHCTAILSILNLIQLSSKERILKSNVYCFESLYRTVSSHNELREYIFAFRLEIQALTKECNLLKLLKLKKSKTIVNHIIVNFMPLNLQLINNPIVESTTIHQDADHVDELDKP